MSDPLLLAVRHCAWANARLFEYCAALSPEQLAWTVPGTFGSIHATLAHIVAAESGYLGRLTGEWPGGPIPEDAPPPLGELAAVERSNGERIETLVAGPFDPDRMVGRPGRPSWPARVLVAQYLHHGSDHRAHVGTILGAHGVEPPELDVWAYGVSASLVGPVIA